jgi:hypothetical protein
METPTSPQMANLLKRYRVRTEKELIRMIRNEYLEETGSCTLLEAEGLLEQMLEAEYQRIEGGAYDRILP